MKCQECPKEVDRIAQNLYGSYCSSKCARTAAIKRENRDADNIERIARETK